MGGGGKSACRVGSHSPLQLLGTEGGWGDLEQRVCYGVGGKQKGCVEGGGWWQRGSRHMIGRKDSKGFEKGI